MGRSGEAVLDTSKNFQALDAFAMPLAEGGAKPGQCIASVRQAPRIPLAKLAFDKLFAGLCLLMLAPAMAAIAIAIRMQGQGPCFTMPDWAGRAHIWLHQVPHHAPRQPERAGGNPAH